MELKTTSSATEHVRRIEQFSGLKLEQLEQALGKLNKQERPNLQIRVWPG